MKLFEMFATLSLDTSEFESGATKAIAQSGEIEKAINNISTESIDAEIAALDREIASLDNEIASLDNEIHNLEMANLDAEIASWGAGISDIQSDLDTMDEKASVTQGIIQGLTEVGLELVENALSAMVQFAGESLDYVAESGTEIGNNLKQTRDDFAITTDALKMKVGTALAPIVTAFYDLAESLTGVTSADKVNVMLGQLDSYTFQNLQTVKTSLEGIFGLFEKVERDNSEVMSVEGMTEALQSQIDYWREYNTMLSVLQSRGVSDSFLSQFADGSQESYNTLMSLSKASDEEIATLEETQDKLESYRNAAAQVISDAQLQVDENVSTMMDTIARLATEVSTEDAGQNVFAAAQGIIESLSSQYPNIEIWVNKINTKLGELGSMGVTGLVEEGYLSLKAPSGPPYATGLDYVPYNEFPALLHEGEAVLTKAEATAWRRGETTAAPQEIDYNLLGRSVASAVAGMSVQMDGRTVGLIVTPTVSKEIAREIRRPGR